MDQSVAIIIASIIAVLGTLGGVYFTNSHAIKLEKLRIEQEKLKRNTEIIEEIYSELMLFDELRNQTASDVLSASVPDFLDKTKEIYLKFNRIYTLISLYHPSLKQELGDLYHKFNEYWINVGHLYDARIERQKTTVIDGWKETVEEGRKKYAASHLKLQNSCEALVK